MNWRVRKRKRSKSAFGQYLSNCPVVLNKSGDSGHATIPRPTGYEAGVLTTQRCSSML